MKHHVPGIYPFGTYQDTLTAQHALVDLPGYFYFLPTTDIQHDFPEIEIRELSSGTGSGTASATDTERNTGFVLLQVMEQGPVVPVEIDLASLLNFVSKIYHAKDLSNNNLQSFRTHFKPRRTRRTHFVCFVLFVVKDGVLFLDNC